MTLSFPEKLIPSDDRSRSWADESLPVYGDGMNVRDWLHVYDHCTAIDLILQKREGEAHNIGGHNARPIWKLGGEDDLAALNSRNH